MQTDLKVEGMTCQNCVRHAREALEAVPGVSSAEVDLDSGTAVVQHEGADLEAMIAALDEEGYPAKEA